MMHVHSKEALAHLCTHLLTKMSSGPLHLGLSACMHACFHHSATFTNMQVHMWQFPCFHQLHNKGSQQPCKGLYEMLLYKFESQFISVPQNKSGH